MYTYINSDLPHKVSAFVLVKIYAWSTFFFSFSAKLFCNLNLCFNIFFLLFSFFVCFTYINSIELRLAAYIFLFGLAFFAFTGRHWFVYVLFVSLLLSFDFQLSKDIERLLLVLSWLLLGVEYPASIGLVVTSTYCT